MIIHLILPIIDALICTIAQGHFNISMSLFEATYAIIILSVALLALIRLLRFKEVKHLNNNNPKLKYKSSVMTSSLSLELKESLLHIMIEKKPYLDNDLRLDTLAEILGTSRNNTSQIINEHFDCCFFDFINRYRIDEAAKLISDNTIASSNLTITEISYSCGFNNRTSFYMAFKKFTGNTPGGYQKLDNAH